VDKYERQKTENEKKNNEGQDIEIDNNNSYPLLEEIVEEE